MNQKSSAAIDVAAQQAEAFVGSVPGFDHDVIQFVAQEVFHHALEARLNLEKIGEHSDRREAALHHSRLEQATHGFGRVTVLSDNRFERTFFPESRGKFGAEQIEMTLGSGFLEALGVEQAAKLADL